MKFLKHIILLLFFTPLFIYSEVIPKQYTAKSRTLEIKIDGNPGDEAWISANVADNFIQLEPSEGAQISQDTKIKLWPTPRRRARLSRRPVGIRVCWCPLS